MNIYVASGVTSNLFSTLISLKFIPTSVHIYATSRPTSNTQGLEQIGVRFVDSIDQVPNVHRILWLSTHDNVELLTKLSTIAPTLVISSGAIMDFIRGKQSEESLNPYQRSKLSVMRVPGVTKFVPGFFLEDMPLPTWAPKGLHGDTTQKLFSKLLPEAFDWSKLYSVTPKSYICEAIKTWITSDVKPDMYIVSSDREYRRWELRQLAGFRDLEPKGDARLELIYKDFPHVLAPLTEEEIERALCFLTQR